MTRPVLLIILACSLLMIGFNAALLATAHGAPLPSDAKLRHCMVYLPAMKDAKLRRWCLMQQKRMP